MVFKQGLKKGHLAILTIKWISEKEYDFPNKNDDVQTQECLLQCFVKSENVKRVARIFIIGRKSHNFYIKKWLQKVLNMHNFILMWFEVIWCMDFLDKYIMSYPTIKNPVLPASYGLLRSSPGRRNTLLRSCCVFRYADAAQKLYTPHRPWFQRATKTVLTHCHLSFTYLLTQWSYFVTLHFVNKRKREIPISCSWNYCVQPYKHILKIYNISVYQIDELINWK